MVVMVEVVEESSASSHRLATKKSKGGGCKEGWGWRVKEAGMSSGMKGAAAHEATSRAHTHIVFRIDHSSSLHQRIHEVEEPTVPHPVQGRPSL